ncbi:hypothetical protein A0J61_09935 [Choanephora cucurbitarum]|uniref:F-box domain-containing protein n=1 Tax=Choanephora cucurbitarum TaxID=101091 RepID=A0A1C7N3W2_9FUNG|nr:hypothetical protein A0J61_09935 [Choanephora cucurbitarum]
MNHLPLENCPLEIVQLIANHLTARQKGVCQTVCRFWRHLFISLQYYHVDLLGRHQFELFLQSIEQSDLIGSCVRQLYLDYTMLDYRQLATLFRYCPKLISLSYKRDITTENDAYQMIPSQQIQLRRLVEFQGLDVTHCLLYGGIASHPQITQLSLSFSGLGSKVTKEELIAQLDKMPNLLELSLDSIALTWHDLESIHACCAKLRALEFSNTTMCPEGISLKEKRALENQLVTPAKWLHSFRLRNVKDLNIHFEWMFYIASKYPYLRHIELWQSFSVSTSVEEDMHLKKIDDISDALSRIGKHCRFLKTAKFLNIHMDHRLLEAMDAVGTSLEAISLGDMSDLTLSLLSHLGHSQQNVTHLTVWGWPSLCMPGRMEELLPLLSQASHRLNHLTLSMQFAGIKNSPCSLDQLLTYCSRLSSVELNGFRVLCQPPDPDKTHPRASIPLTSLAIRNGGLTTTLLDRLDPFCPQLESILLDSCDVIGDSHTRQLTIHRPDRKLKSLQLSYLYSPVAYYHRFGSKSNAIQWYDLTMGDQEHQVFELKEYEYYQSHLSFDYEQKEDPLHRPTQCVHHGDIELEPYRPSVSIKCRSLLELRIGGFPVI